MLFKHSREIDFEFANPKLRMSAKSWVSSYSRRTWKTPKRDRPRETQEVAVLCTNILKENLKVHAHQNNSVHLFTSKGAMYLGWMIIPLQYFQSLISAAILESSLLIAWTMLCRFPRGWALSVPHTNQENLETWKRAFIDMTLVSHVPLVIPRIQ